MTYRHQNSTKAERLTPNDAPSSKCAEAQQVKPRTLGKIKFRVAGREITLRQRIPGKFAPWYLTGRINGKRFNHALGTDDAKTAKQVAKVKFIQPALDQEWGLVAANKKRKHWATVGELIAAWESFDLGGGERHRREAAQSLRSVLRHAGVADPDSASAGILTGQTVMDYFAFVVRLAEAQPSQKAAARKKRSGASRFNQAKSVLQPAAIYHYKKEELPVPDLSDFMGAALMMRRSILKGSKVVYEPPNWPLIDAVVAAWPKLANWNEFAAIALELAFGLRKSEVSQARWDWFVERNGAWRCDGEADVKNQSGAVEVPALNPFWSIFWERATAEGAQQRGPMVLTGSPTERGSTTFRRVSKWLRGLGWAKQKTNHALRAYAGSEVALNFGMHEAQAWCRHDSASTTEKYYTRQWREASSGRAGRVSWARVSEVGGS